MQSSEENYDEINEEKVTLSVYASLHRPHTDTPVNVVDCKHQNLQITLKTRDRSCNLTKESFE